MKKNYIAPNVEITEIELQQLIAVSGVSSEGKGIGYGGVDEEGTKDPAARRRRRKDVWDDEEEDDFGY